MFSIPISIFGFFIAAFGSWIFSFSCYFFNGFLASGAFIISSYILPNYIFQEDFSRTYFCGINFFQVLKHLYLFYLYGQFLFRLPHEF